MILVSTTERKIRSKFSNYHPSETTLPKKRIASSFKKKNFYGEKEEEEMSHAIQEDTVVETLAQADPFSAMAPPPIRRPVQVPPLQPRRIVEPIYQPRPNTRVEGKQITENDEPISPPEGNVW